MSPTQSHLRETSSAEAGEMNFRALLPRGSREIRHNVPRNRAKRRMARLATSTSQAGRPFAARHAPTSSEAPRGGRAWPLSHGARLGTRPQSPGAFGTEPLRPAASHRPRPWAWEVLWRGRSRLRACHGAACSSPRGPPTVSGGSPALAGA